METNRKVIRLANAQTIGPQGTPWNFHIIEIWPKLNQCSQSVQTGVRDAAFLVALAPHLCWSILRLILT